MGLFTPRSFQLPATTSFFIRPRTTPGVFEDFSSSCGPPRYCAIKVLFRALNVEAAGVEPSPHLRGPACCGVKLRDSARSERHAFYAHTQSNAESRRKCVCKCVRYLMKYSHSRKRKGWPSILRNLRDLTKTPLGHPPHVHGKLSSVQLSAQITQGLKRWAELIGQRRNQRQIFQHEFLDSCRFVAAVFRRRRLLPGRSLVRWMRGGTHFPCRARSIFYGWSAWEIRKPRLPSCRQ